MFIFRTTLVCLFCILLPAALPSTAQAGKTARATCGNYSFILPKGFAVKYHMEEGDAFKEESLINSSFLGLDSEDATITCMRERKTEYYDLILPRKRSIKIQTAPRQTTPMIITAAEAMSGNGLQYVYSILEEQAGRGREVRGMRYYIPVIEMNAPEDDYHTLLLISDFRKNGEFFDMEAYRSKVNKTAVQVLRGIKKTAP